jgi:hypothetical protein
MPKKQHLTLHETMEKSAYPSSGCQSCSLDGLNQQQDPSTAAPHQRSASVVRNASMVHQPGGENRASTQQSACLMAYLQYLVFGIFKSQFTFDVNPFSFLT